MGYSYGGTRIKISVLNSLNYGAITDKGKTSNGLKIGGILGYTSGIISIENCVSAGKIDSNEGTIGSIIGYALFKATIESCFWTNDTNVVDVV